MNPAPITQPWEGLPDDLKLEMMLEMLVDDELPEGQRATLLRSLDAMLCQWRTLALRFLERQTEHASVREFISNAKPKPAPENYPFPVQRNWHLTRVAATFILLAGVSAVVFVTVQKKNATSQTVATTEILPISGKTMGAANNADVPVDLVRTTDLPSTILQGSMDKNSSRTIFIVPQGPDKAAVIPVTTTNEVIY